MSVLSKATGRCTRKKETKGACKQNYFKYSSHLRTADRTIGWCSLVNLRDLCEADTVAGGGYGVGFSIFCWGRPLPSSYQGNLLTIALRRNHQTASRLLKKGACVYAFLPGPIHNSAAGHCSRDNCCQPLVVAEMNGWQKLLSYWPYLALAVSLIGLIYIFTHMS